MESVHINKHLGPIPPVDPELIRLLNEQTKMTPRLRTFDEFASNVHSSVTEHAKRKNYTDGGADDPNKLLKVLGLLEIGSAHGIGEIVYKCAEYLRGPRQVILEKIAGWAFVLWREHKGE